MIMLVVFKGFLLVKNLEIFDSNCPRSLYILLLRAVYSALTDKILSLRYFIIPGNDSYWC